MAVAYVNKVQGVGTGNPVGGASGLTLPCGTDPNRLAVICLFWNSVTGRTGGSPTCGDVAMTQVGTVKQTTTVSTEMWYYIGPGTGDQSIKVPNSGALNIRVDCASFSGVDQSSPLGASGNAGTSGANPTHTLALTTTGALHISGMVDDRNSTSGGDHTAVYSTDEGTWVNGMQYSLDNPVGNHAMGWTVLTDNWALLAAEFKQFLGIEATQAITVSEGVLAQPIPDGTPTEVSTDGGLENWNSTTDLTSWTENIAGSSTVNRETSGVHGGTYCARFDIDASDNIAGIYQTVVLPVSTWCTLSFWYKNSGNIRIKWGLSSASTVWLNGTTGAWGGAVNNPLPVSTEWQYFSITFLSHSSYTSYDLDFQRMSGDGTSKSIYVDDISLKKYETGPATLTIQASENVGTSEVVTGFLPILLLSALQSITIADVPLLTVQDLSVSTAQTITVTDSPSLALGDMSISAIQGVTVTDTPTVNIPVSRLQGPTYNSGTTTVTDSFTNTPAEGSLLLAYVYTDNLTIGNTTVPGFTLANNVSGSSIGRLIALFYKVAGAAESKDVVVNGYSGAVLRVVIEEWTGLSNATVDKTAIVDDSGGTVTTRATGTTATTTAAKELLIAFNSLSASSGGGESWDHSFTLNYSSNNMHTAYYAVSATAAYHSDFNWTTARYAVGSITTFKEGLPTLKPSVSDPITVTDSPTVAVGGMTVLATQSVTVGDVPSGSISLNPSVVDSTTVTDTPTVVTGGMTVSTTQSISVGDVPLLSVGSPQIAATQGITVTDSPSVTAGPPPVLVTQSIAVSDVPSVVTGGMEVSATQGIAVADVPTVLVVGDVSISAVQSITVTDVPTAITGGMSVSVSDAITVTDIPTVVPEAEGTLSRSVSDGVTVTDIPSLKVGDPQISVTQSITITDVPTVATGGMAVSEAQSVSVTDTPAVVVGDMSILAIQSITASDVPAVVTGGLSASASDGTTISESVSGSVGTPQISVAQSITVTDVPTVRRIAEGEVYVSDSISISDTPTVSIPSLGLISVQDSVTVSDSVTRDIYDGGYHFNVPPKVRSFSRIYPKPLVSYYVEVLESVRIGESVTVVIT